jgi:hypothetical protein
MVPPDAVMVSMYGGEVDGEGEMHDPLWIKSLFGVHTAAGCTAFVLAPLALAAAKRKFAPREKMRAVSTS